jgi:hypothetical protein
MKKAGIILLPLKTEVYPLFDNQAVHMGSLALRPCIAAGLPLSEKFFLKIYVIEWSKKFPPNIKKIIGKGSGPNAGKWYRPILLEAK